MQTELANIHGKLHLNRIALLYLKEELFLRTRDIMPFCSFNVNCKCTIESVLSCWCHLDLSMLYQMTLPADRSTTWIELIEFTSRYSATYTSIYLFLGKNDGRTQEDGGNQAYNWVNPDQCWVQVCSYITAYYQSCSAATKQHHTRIGKKRKAMNWFSHGYLVMVSGIFARGHICMMMMAMMTKLCNISTILQPIGWPGHIALVYSIHLWYWTCMLWSIGTSQNKVVCSWFP